MNVVQLLRRNVFCLKRYMNKGDLTDLTCRNHLFHVLSPPFLEKLTGASLLGLAQTAGEPTCPPGEKQHAGTNSLRGSKDGVQQALDA